ncbi:MAG: hypothetical protein J1G01_00975 [Clostridiales bacterium]|nr:hypothetical protein [Clostridiales bacterium]
MNQDYAYAEDENEEGITFKKVGHFFKKSWLRMIIYAVTLVLIATAVAVPIKVFYKSEPVAQTSIEFIYDGIENGLDPNGGMLDTDSIISTTVLNNAVQSGNLGGVIKDISKLRSKMRVEGVETDEYVRLKEAAANGDKDAANRLRNYTMIPTRFNIIISDPEELGLSDDQAKTLLNKIVASFYADFQSRFAKSDMFLTSVFTLAENEQYEFFDIYDMYTMSLDSVKTYLTRISESSSAASTVTFNQLLSEYNIISGKYVLFNAYITSNNIWRDKETARNALNASKTEINNKLEPLKSYIVSLKELIDKIKPNTETTDNGGIHIENVKYPPELLIYIDKLNEANNQVLDYEIKIKNIDTRLEKLNEESSATDKALIDSAIETLSELETQTTEFVRKVQEHYKSTFLSSSVRQIQSPIVTRRSIDFSLWVVYIVAIIAGVVAAGIVTIVKITKANAAAETAQKTDEKQAESAK